MEEHIKQRSIEAENRWSLEKLAVTVVQGKEFTLLARSNLGLLGLQKFLIFSHFALGI